MARSRSLTLTLSIGISNVVRTLTGEANGVSTRVTRGLVVGLLTLNVIPFLCCVGLLAVGVCGGGGESGNSTIGLGVLVGTKSDCPVDRNMPFRTGHGA